MQPLGLSQGHAAPAALRVDQGSARHRPTAHDDPAAVLPARGLLTTGAPQPPSDTSQTPSPSGRGRGRGESRSQAHGSNPAILTPCALTPCLPYPLPPSPWLSCPRPRELAQPWTWPQLQPHMLLFTVGPDRPGRRRERVHGGKGSSPPQLLCGWSRRSQGYPAECLPRGRGGLAMASPGMWGGGWRQGPSGEQLGCPEATGAGWCHVALGQARGVGGMTDGGGVCKGGSTGGDMWVCVQAPVDCV